MPERVIPHAELPDMLVEREKTIQNIDTMARTVVTPYGAETYYEAANPGYKRFFTRDSLLTMMIIGDPIRLAGQVDFAVHRLGQIANPPTGEQPGLPPHEWPAPGELIKPFREGRYTTYNACDTGAELLRGIATLIEVGYPDARDKYAAAIKAVTGYIRSHVNSQGLFIEDPAFAGVRGSHGHDRHFALRRTDWKDSELNRATEREPNYPIVYSLAHFQNADALQRIGRAIGNERLARFGRYMTEVGFQYLWNQDHFVTAIDKSGVIDSPASDSLEALAYINPSQLPIGYAKKIEDYMKSLETDAGYRAGIPVADDLDMYHMQIWTHSQAIMHVGARRYGLGHAEAVTQRITQFIDRNTGDYPELVNASTYDLNGNLQQLWAMAADAYFLSPERSFL